MDKISYMVKKIKEPMKKTGSSERSMIKYISKCNNRNIFYVPDTVAKTV